MGKQVKEIKKISLKNIDNVPNDHWENRVAFKILAEKINEIIDFLNTLQKEKGRKGI